MIAIIDCGAGNLGSVRNALGRLGAKCLIARDASSIRRAGRIILPGVGAFGHMMNSLEKKKLVGPIKESIEQGKPFLGICLGMQALFEKSEESPGIKGLSIFKGSVVRFRKGKVPQTGWNMIETKKPCLKPQLVKGGYAYFVNSYYPKPYDKPIISATSNYNGEFTAAVQHKNILAVQFHPEKSGKYGLSMLGRWLRLRAVW